jgi:hypothetical protein
MWSGLDEMQKETLETIQAALHHGYFSVGKELQEAHIKGLQELLDKIGSFKKQAQERRDETAANTSFVMMQYVNGVAEFLSMWVQLKEDKLEQAWESLVEAQGSIACGLRLLELKGFSSFNARLDAAEKILFPPQVFTSSALRFAWSECSICGQKYGECDHLAMKLYMGEMCRQVVHDITYVDHVAIVKEPDDKRLRFPVVWGAINLCSLTRREVPQEAKSEEGSAS